MMKQNVDSVDRIVRVMISIILLSLLTFLEGNIRLIGLIVTIPILTAFIKFCPLYTLFQINTNSSK